MAEGSQGPQNAEVKPVEGKNFPMYNQAQVSSEVTREKFGENWGKAFTPGEKPQSKPQTKEEEFVSKFGDEGASMEEVSAKSGPDYKGNLLSQLGKEDDAAKQAVQHVNEEAWENGKEAREAAAASAPKTSAPVTIDEASARLKTLSDELAGKSEKAGGTEMKLPVQQQAASEVPIAPPEVKPAITEAPGTILEAKPSEIRQNPVTSPIDSLNNVGGVPETTVPQSAKTEDVKTEQPAQAEKRPIEVINELQGKTYEEITEKPVSEMSFDELRVAKDKLLEKFPNDRYKYILKAGEKADAEIKKKHGENATTFSVSPREQEEASFNSLKEVYAEFEKEGKTAEISVAPAGVPPVQPAPAEASTQSVELTQEAKDLLTEVTNGGLQTPASENLAGNLNSEATRNESETIVKTAEETALEEVDKEIAAEAGYLNLIQKENNIPLTSLSPERLEDFYLFKLRAFKRSPADPNVFGLFDENGKPFMDADGKPIDTAAYYDELKQKGVLNDLLRKRYAERKISQVNSAS